MKAPAEVVSAINEQQELIVSLARVNVAEVSAEAEKPAASNATLVSGCEVYCHLEGLVDFEAERARLSKEREKLEKDVAKLDKKLSNPGYLAKAKPEIRREGQGEARRVRREARAGCPADRRAVGRGPFCRISKLHREAPRGMRGASFFATMRD